MLAAICTVCKENKGKQRVENTSIEFICPKKQKDEDGHEEASYLLCKYESSLYFALRQDREAKTHFVLKAFLKNPPGRGS